MIFQYLGNMIFGAVRHLRNKNYRSIRRVFCKKVFLKTLQNSAESTCTRVLLLIKLQAIKKKLWHRCFPVIFAKFLRKPFSIKGNAQFIFIRSRSKRTSPQKWQFLEPSPPISPLVTISGCPPPLSMSPGKY